MTEAPQSRPVAELSTGELIAKVSDQSAQLVRYELEMAQAEMTAKAKGVGVGAGLFGGAGLVAGYGVGTLVATAVLALALVVDAWLAALIVTVVLFAIACIAALLGKSKVAQATPVVPEKTIESVKQDAAAVKDARR